MSQYYYVTVATGEKYINKFTRYAVGSLLKAGIKEEDIYIGVNNKKDRKCLKSVFPNLNNVQVINESLDHVVWRYSSGKRKYSLLKAAALYKMFPEPVENKFMIYFDGDVLFYKNPASFLDTKYEKTWFHHGKCLIKKAKERGVKPGDIDIKSYESLKNWCSGPMAYLMHKHGIEKLPDRECVAGLYLLHPRDHKKLLELTYKGCLENSYKKEFRKNEGGGDQKPMNAALYILNIDFHGGSRFFCPEHEDYFDHFFGKDNMKEMFWKKAKGLGLR